MNVQELMNKLAKLDPKLPVICISEEEASVNNPQGLFVIVDVEELRAKRDRNSDRIPMISYESGEGSKRLAVISITSDF